MIRETDVKDRPFPRKAKARRRKSRSKTSKEVSLATGFADRRDVEDGGLDPRTVRSLIFLCAWIVILLLSVVNFKNQCTQLEYRCRELLQSVADIGENNKDLNAEIATLQSFTAVEARSKDLGLVNIATEDVLYIHVQPPSKEPVQEIEVVQDKTDVLGKVASQLRSMPLVQEGAG